MADFKPLIKTINDSIKAFGKYVQPAQKAMLDSILTDLAGLDLVGDNIAVGVKNVRLISTIKGKLLSTVLSPQYKAAVSAYLSTFDKVSKEQDKYFKAIEDKYTPLALGAEIQKQSVETVAHDLTERGIDANVVSAVEDILRTSITTGGSVAELRTQLTNNITSNGTGPGTLERYTKQITTDALNQYSAQYTQIVSDSLGLHWHRYTGSLLETSREFCEACRAKEWIHDSEFADVIAGNFPEFADAGGTINQKTGLPDGMIPDTTPASFPILRGGYNCGHQLRPVPDSQVPEAIRAKIKPIAVKTAVKAQPAIPATPAPATPPAPVLPVPLPAPAPTPAAPRPRPTPAPPKPKPAPKPRAPRAPKAPPKQRKMGPVKPVPAEFQKKGMTRAHLNELNVDTYQSRGLDAQVRKMQKRGEYNNFFDGIKEWLISANYVRGKGNEHEAMFHWAAEHNVTTHTEIYRGSRLDVFDTVQFRQAFEALRTAGKINFGKETTLFSGRGKSYDMRLASYTNDKRVMENFGGGFTLHTTVKNDYGIRGLRLGHTYSNDLATSEHETVLGDNFEYEVEDVQIDEGRRVISLTLRQKVK